ncbi:hypothetical protein LXL04_006843 [Taraxacum kok-saghyz]
MDQYFEVDSFRSLCCGQRWFNFTCAHVVCVWRDYARKRLIIMFVDKNREKMMAVVPTSLMQRYENYPLVDKLYSIKHFKLSWDPFGCPKFEGYTFLYDDYAIDVSETTRFTLLEENNFPFYPLDHTIETLVRISRQRLLIGKL